MKQRDLYTRAPQPPGPTATDGELLARIKVLEALTAQLAAFPFILVEGIIDGAGDIIRGSGFTVELTDTNKFAVAFNTELPRYPSITLGVGGTDAPDHAVLYLYSQSGFTVKTFDDTGAPAARGFHFHAFSTLTDE